MWEMVKRWLFKGSPFGGEGATLKALSPSFAASEVRDLSVCKAMRCRRKNTQAEGWVQISVLPFTSSAAWMYSFAPVVQW